MVMFAVDLILAAISLEWPVEDMMTSMPRTITKDKLAAEALHLMEKNQPRPITVLPVVDTDNVMSWHCSHYRFIA